MQSNTTRSRNYRNAQQEQGERQITLWLPPDVVQSIDRIAARDLVSRRAVITRMIREVATS